MADANPSPLHLVGRFGDPNSGAELEVLDLARRVRPHRPVRVWSDIPVHPGFKPHGVQQILPWSRQVPYGGTLALGSVYVETKGWIAYAKPQRLLLQYNVSNHGNLFERLEHLQQATGVTPELTFVSDMVRSAVGLPGPVIPSWIDLTPFLAVPMERPAARPFTVGRLSRDFLGKHAPQDTSLYRMLASQGMHIRVQGGTCLAPYLQGVAGVELLAAGAMPAADLLASLDVFFYRLGGFTEAYGRVVVEAMATGLPVVAAANGGYASAVEHGLSGYLVNTQEEAYEAIQKLAMDAELRGAIRKRARERALELHGEPAGAEAIGFYLR